MASGGGDHLSLLSSEDSADEIGKPETKQFKPNY